MEHENEEQLVQTCYKHPNRETLIRCNQCDKPICLDCAVSTPTGYRCKDCIKEQQKRFNNSISRDYFAAAIIAFLIGAIGTFLVYQISFFPSMTAIILGIALGTGTVSLVRAATQKRRSKKLKQVTIAAAALGGLAPLLQYIIGFFRMVFLGQYGALLSYTLSVGWGLLYIVLLCGTIASNVGGFSLRRR